MINITIQEAINGYVVSITNWPEASKTEICERYGHALDIVNNWLKSELKEEAFRIQSTGNNL